MQITEFIRKKLDEHIVGSYVGYRGEHMPKGIIFIDDDMPPREDYFCITDYEHLMRFIGMGHELKNTYIFLASKERAGTFQIPRIESVTVYDIDLGFARLYNRLQDISQHLGTGAVNPLGKTESFADFMHDVISMDTIRADEILSRLRLYPNTNDRPFRVSVFQFEAEPVPVTAEESLISELQLLFPMSNTTRYFDILINVMQLPPTKSDYVSISPEVTERLQDICTRYGVMCGISNYTHNFAMLRTEYLCAKTVLRIGRKMRRDKETRVFTQEEYFCYEMMDMCYSEFSRMYRHENYIYMMHPGLSHILRYDRKNNSNLRETLQCFLLNDRNYTKTAANLFMHRNTVLYKVNKALELLEDDIENPIIRQRVLWSCMMCDYCINCLGIEPEVYPKE